MKQDELRRLQKIVEVLRSEKGCPWDREQTHESLKPACIEEAAEVLAGIDILSATGKAENLKEELGDLLLQVVFHARLAEEAGLFNLDDVAKTVSDKMERRHPHVFAGAAVYLSIVCPSNFIDVNFVANKSQIFFLKCKFNYRMFSN